MCASKIGRYTKLTFDGFKKLHVSAAKVMLLAMIATPGYAAFALNFDANGGPGDYAAGPYLGGCGAGSACTFSANASGVPLDTDSPWFYETYVDPANGQQYWHMIIGTLNPGAEPVDGQGRMIGFFQDVYIRMGASWSYMDDTQNANGDVIGRVDSGVGSFSNSGGFTSGLGGLNGFGWVEGDQAYTDYPTGGNSDVDMVNQPKTCEPYAGSGCDPLRADSVWTGNGSANPKRVLMRQLNNDGSGFYSEFLKDVEDRKARVTQEVIDGPMSSEFQADMRGSDYDTNSVVLPLSSIMGSANTFVNKASVSTAPADFDQAINGQVVTISAGRYTWSPGALAATNTADAANGGEYGWLDPALFPGQATYRDTYYASDPNYVANDFMPIPIYDHGGYSYTNGSFDQMNQSWKNIMDPAQNPCGGDPFC